MKRIIFILPILFMYSCCTIRQTDEQSLKKIADLTASDSLLRVREKQKDEMIAQRDSTIFMLRDSLWKCREDSRIVK